MYFTLSPFFYYMANLPYIEQFIIIESNGEAISSIQINKLESIIEKFVDKQSHGVNEYKKQDYVKYICSHIK